MKCGEGVGVQRSKAGAWRRAVRARVGDGRGERLGGARRALRVAGAAGAGCCGASCCAEREQGGEGERGGPGAASTARHRRGHSADHGDVRVAAVPCVPPRPRPDSSVPVSAVR